MSGKIALLNNNDDPLFNQLSQQVQEYGYTLAPPDDSEVEAVISFDKDYKANGKPLIYISQNADFTTRLQAIRNGSNAFFTLPIDASSLIDKINSLTADNETYHILIIDDDEISTAYYSIAFEQAGMRASVINNPYQAVDFITSTHVDLVLMDYMMPGCNGGELAKVLRQHENYISLPIVFLSGVNNLELGLNDLAIDDFIPKTTSIESLVKAVKIKAKRSRELHSIMIKDGLTGLINHSRLKEEIGIEIARCTRNKGTFSFAMIDIDKFKSVNDTYGHPAGDQIIKSLSQMLLTRLRKSDIIGRYGGEEFGVILADCEPQYAIKVMDDLRACFQKITHLYKGNEIVSTFSCGIADFSKYQSVDAIIQYADKALYQAKANGRNCVVYES